MSLVDLEVNNEEPFKSTFDQDSNTIAIEGRVDAETIGKVSTWKVPLAPDTSGSSSLKGRVTQGLNLNGPLAPPSSPELSKGNLTGPQNPILEQLANFDESTLEADLETLAFPESSESFLGEYKDSDE